jgi:hypothetical protein
MYSSPLMGHSWGTAPTFENHAEHAMALAKELRAQGLKVDRRDQDNLAKQNLLMDIGNALKKCRSVIGRWLEAHQQLLVFRRLCVCHVRNRCSRQPTAPLPQVCQPQANPRRPQAPQHAAGMGLVAAAVGRAGVARPAHGDCQVLHGGRAWRATGG